MMRSPSYPNALRFAVVITDGHVTGNPCGGIKVSAERARDEGIRIFSVAASKNIDEMGMREIANSPGMVFRNDFMAVDLSQDRPTISTQTIDRIIKTMVTHKHKDTHGRKREARGMPLTLYFVFAGAFVVCRGKNADGRNVDDRTEVRASISPLTACLPV